ncbi:MAG: PBP1A family penicillin-binding protein [Pseudomonadota bacterium]
MSDPFELEADAPLVHLLLERFAEDEGIDLSDDRLALMRLLQAARAARADLGLHDVAEVTIPFLCNDAKGRPLSLQDTITRRDQRRAQADEGFWGTLDTLEAVLFDQGARPAPAPAAEPLVLTTPAGGYSTNLPVVRKSRRWGRLLVRATGAFIVLLTLAVGYLAYTAPLSKSLEPPTPPSITLLADDGSAIARRGAIIGAAVDAAKLPDHVTQAFLAIEDRRFYSHLGIDPRGIARAVWHNTTSDARSQGGSTITQQLAKNAFLDSDRTASRKIREAMIALWLEAWLTKNEILSRYLSNVYFGDNVYGLQAAAKHFFGRDASALTTAQAALLAGLVKAPSRLNPTDNPAGAKARAKLVVGAMVDAGFLTEREADSIAPAKPRRNIKQALPTGTYFADWVLPAARDQAGEIKTEARVKTTLDRRIQGAAERTVKRSRLRQAQVAIVAMRPDGRVVAMVGGKNYAVSPFNRATQARRQPGSAFKLFVYLAALRSGLTPQSMVEDNPVTIADWSPKNIDGRYLGKITLRRAFARSSNVVAARLIQQVGVKEVIRAARDLGISTPIPNEATIALGTNTVSLLELTAAYAAVANGRYPISPRGVAEVKEKGWLDNLTGSDRAFGGDVRSGMLELLAANVAGGSGRAAALSVPTYGKTGTTQDNRDALFVGFANDLVVGVWVGNDDNTPNPGLSGGGLPAQIWRDFMMQAIRVGPAAAPGPELVIDNLGDAAVPGDGFDNAADAIGEVVEDALPAVQSQLEGLGLNLSVGRDGSIQVTTGDDRERPRRRDPRDQPRDQRGDGPRDPLDTRRRE